MIVRLEILHAFSNHFCKLLSLEILDGGDLLTQNPGRLLFVQLAARLIDKTGAEFGEIPVDLLRDNAIDSKIASHGLKQNHDVSREQLNFCERVVQYGIV